MCSPSERVKHVVELYLRNLFVRHCDNELKNHVFLNHPEHLKYMSAAIQSAGVKPELEVFDTGHILNAINLIKNGLIQPPFSVLFGVDYGAPAEWSR